MHPVNIYRIIGFQEMEDSIYVQQVVKFSLFARIVDDKEVQAMNIADSEFSQTETSLKAVDVKAMKYENPGESLAKHVLTSIEDMISEVTWHDFDESESDISFEAKQKAINDYNMICMQHSRLLSDEKSELVDVKPHGIFAGELLVPPFAPVLSNTTSSMFVDILPVLPNFDCFELEEEVDGTCNVELQKLDMKKISKLNLKKSGTYRWRVRGYFHSFPDPSAWSDWSAAFIV